MPNAPTNEELAADVARVARELARDSVSRREYGVRGTYSEHAIESRFGSWTAALRAAGLRVAGEAQSHTPRITATVAQSGEPAPCSRDVAGSTPAGGSAPEAPVDPLAAHEERRDVVRMRKAHNELLERLRTEKLKTEFLREMSAGARTPHIMRSERASGLREMTAVAIASDWHVEETVEAVKANYRNEYNLTIADRRVTRFFNGCVDLVEHHRADGRTVVRDMVLGLIGDLMSGHIHDELAESNALTPIETADWLMPRISAGIRLLLDQLDLRTLIVCTSPGNHGRDTKRTRIATNAEHSYEWLIYKMLAREFAKDERVQFDASPTFQTYAEVYDFVLGFTHGDSVQFNGGIGGLSVPLLRRIPKWDSVRYAHQWHLGHFHTARDFGRALVNGSLIGWAPFGQWIGADFEEPSQTFYMLDSKRGRCHTTKLWVHDLPEYDAAA